MDINPLQINPLLSTISSPNRPLNGSRVAENAAESIHRIHRNPFGIFEKYISSFALNGKREINLYDLYIRHCSDIAGTQSQS